MIEITKDLETIPDQREGAYEKILEEVQENFKAPSTLTKEQAAIDLGITDKDEIKFTSKDAMIAKWEKEMASVKSADVADGIWRKTALDGSKGEIIVIGFAVEDQEPIALYRNLGESERDLIGKFFDVLNDQTKLAGGSNKGVKFVGHNIEAFDLRFLYQRAVINKIKPPVSLTPSRYSDSIFDTMTAWAGWQNRISLDNLCKALGIKTPKSEIDGSKVWDFVKEGKIADVAEYCKGDVIAARAAYRQMTFK